MVSSFLLLYKQDGRPVEQVPFVSKDGHMIDAIQNIAAHITDMGIAELFYEKIAGDRLEIILDQQITIRDQAKEIAELKEWAAFVSPPVKEMVR